MCKRFHLQVNTFALVWRQMDNRVNHNTKQMLQTLLNGFGASFLQNFVVIVTHWNMHDRSIDLRFSVVPPLTEDYMRQTLRNVFDNVFKGEEKVIYNKVPILFLDAFYNSSSCCESYHFEKNAITLLYLLHKATPYNSSQVQFAQSERDQLNERIKTLQENIADIETVLYYENNVLPYLKKNILHIILLSTIVVSVFIFGIVFLYFMRKQWIQIHSLSQSQLETQLELSGMNNIYDENVFIEEYM